MRVESKYRHLLILLIYLLLYMLCFYYLEKSVSSYRIIHLKLDDFIPFCEYFVIPYLLWFPYIAGVTLYFCLANRPGFPRLAAFLMISMTLFLIVSALYPNGQNLRPLYFTRHNVLTDIVGLVYASDTPTNILPSIHVLNTVAVQAAICTDRKLSSRRPILIGSWILSVLIIASTVLIKQHSMMDVILALIIGSVLYLVLYRGMFSLRPEAQKWPIQ